MLFGLAALPERGSKLGDFIWGRLTWCGGYSRAFVTREADGLALHWDDVIDSAAMVRFKRGPYLNGEWRHGFAFHTSAELDARIQIDDRQSPSLTPDERAQIRASFLNGIEDHSSIRLNQFERETLERGDAVFERTLWAGYPANTALLLSVVGFIGSLAWLPRLGELRRIGRLQAERCPRCRYDIRQLPTRCCPECGEKWSEDEARHIADC
ncbi:MAG TPA: hypothetical protein VG797_02045 [Phycisphaerales bacterium]|nr:hypothetical protein [Phycisphaerales bacterium]